MITKIYSYFNLTRINILVYITSTSSVNVLKLMQNTDLSQTVILSVEDERKTERK